MKQDVICRLSGAEAKLSAADEAVSVEEEHDLAGNVGHECLAEDR